NRGAPGRGGRANLTARLCGCVFSGYDEKVLRVMRNDREKEMSTSDIPFDTFLTASTFWTPLPGPSRKRTVQPYLYRVTYCNPDREEAGWGVAWQVTGGRLAYEVAAEREEGGGLRWHGTCADAVYRAENEGRPCKHVKGLLGAGRPRGDARQAG